MRRVELNIPHEGSFQPCPPAKMKGWHVLIDDARPAADTEDCPAAAVIRAGHLAPGAPFQVVRLMSPHTGREHGRAYVLAGGVAYLQGPSRSAGWKEMDRAVAAALSCRVARYGVNMRGGVTLPAPGVELAFQHRAGGSGGADGPPSAAELEARLPHQEAGGHLCDVCAAVNATELHDGGAVLYLCVLCRRPWALEKT